MGSSHHHTDLPDWIPDATRRYIAHVAEGRPIRAIARDSGVHASTVLRQVRRTEQRRDDLLFDLALERLNATGGLNFNKTGDGCMTARARLDIATEDGEPLGGDALRVLTRMLEPGACLAIARDMEKAVVVRDGPGEVSVRTAVVDRSVAEALALREWIEVAKAGRIMRYRLSASGRAAVRRHAEAAEAADPQPFAAQHQERTTREVEDDRGRRRRVRYNAAESPLLTLSRRRDAEGNPFLSAELVVVGERLREDFELAQMGPRVAQNWDRFLTGGGRGDFGSGTGGGGSDAARRRVGGALSDLGPGLGDVVLRCCCFLEGLEAVEKSMGWSARSGKIVLRIALTRLKRHYDALGDEVRMIR